MCSHPWSHTHKVRVTGDIMVVNSEIEPGKGNRSEYPEGGFRIYDIKDKTNPKLITFHKTHGKGVHRFDLDENYAYISTEMEGYVGNILVIYDIRNPSKPTEVGRWCLENQHVADGDTPHPKGTEHRLHHAMRIGNQMFAGCWMSGVAIIDVSDITKPKTVSRYEYKPAAPGAVAYLPRRCAIRSAASASRSRPRRSATRAVPTPASRTRRSGPGTSPIPTNPKILCTYELPESVDALRHQRDALRGASAPGEDRHRQSGLRHLVRRRSAHHRHQRSRQSRRSAAISFRSRAPAPTRRSPTTSYKDDRGLLFLTDKKLGFDVIEFKG